MTQANQAVVFFRRDAAVPDECRDALVIFLSESAPRLKFRVFADGRFRIDHEGADERWHSTARHWRRLV